MLKSLGMWGIVGEQEKNLGIDMKPIPADTTGLYALCWASVCSKGPLVKGAKLE